MAKMATARGAVHEHLHRNHQPEFWFVLIALGILAFGVLLWYIIGLATPNGGSNNPNRLPHHGAVVLDVRFVG